MNLATTRTEYVTAMTNVRLADYYRDLQAILGAPMTTDTRIWFFRVATEQAADELVRLERFGCGVSTNE